MKNVIPNLTGYEALYHHAENDPIPDDETEFTHPKITTRKVIGFDERGYPLVMCDDKLVPASKAEFMYWSEFKGLTAEKDENVNDVIFQAIDHFLERNLSYSLPERMAIAVKEAVAEHLASKLQTTEIE